MRNSSHNLNSLSSNRCVRNTDALLSFTDELLEFSTPEEIIELLDSLPAIVIYAQANIGGHEMGILEQMKKYFWNIYKLQIQEKHETEKQQLLASKN